MSGLADVLRVELGDRYRLERELGRGGMATVYLAQDLRHERPVAVKVLHHNLGETVGADRFLREIRLAARLTHPNILPVFDSGEIRAPGSAAPVLYYVMPYVSGESLRARLERERQLPLADAVRIASSTAAALDYAHAQGVVHRDVKPENILLEAGEAVLADLGIARAIDVAAGERLTETGIGIGTPAYMSPEQVAADPHVDGRSDQYSLACIAYEMLAGEPPFTGASAQAVMVRRVTEPPPRLSTVRDGCPPAMDAVLARAMARTPADRFASAGEFARAFAAAGADSSAARRPGGTAAQGLGGSAARRLVGGGIAAVAVLAVAAVVLLRQPAAAVAGPASVMAVVPLTPSTPDTLLERLGRDLVVTVSQTLDGTGGVRAVDAQTVLLRARNRESGGLEQARRIATELGAGAVLHGSLVRVGSLVRADVMLATADSGAPLARVSVAAPADSIGAFTDSIARGVLRQVWRTGEAPSPSLDVAMRTRSFDALRAFLAGEQLAVRNDWAAAADAYARAIEADSTLWLAYWRLAYALGWHGEPVDSAITTALAAHAAELPARERLLAEATLRVGDSASAAISRLRELTTAYPDYWFGWLVYADYMTHFGSAVGIPRRDALAAFERTVTLNPNLLPAWEHHAWLALLEQDTAASARALEGLHRVGAPTAETFGWDEYTSLALADRLIRGDSAGAAVLMERHVNDLAALADPSFGATALLRHRLPEAQVEVTRRVLASAPRTSIERHRSALLLAFAERGAWDSVFAVVDEAGQPPVMGGAVGAYRLAVLAVLTEAVPAAVADQRRAAALRSPDRDPRGRAELAWLDGVLAFAQSDTGGLAAAGTALAAESADNAPLLRRSLAAFQRGLRGEREAAARELAAIEWDRAERAYADAAPNPALLAVNRIVAARWLAEAGDRAEAARLLDWVDGAYTTFAGGGLNAVVTPIVTYERGRIAEADGRTRDAAEHYREFLRIYDLAPAAHAPLVQHAAEFIRRGPAA